MHFHEQTPPEVARLLESLYVSRRRVRLHYGDHVTGRDWLETHDVTGTIGQSCGPQKVPLLIHNARSLGGPALLDHCIVRIRDTKTGKELYRHPSYHTGEVLLRIVPGEYPYEVARDGEPVARFQTEAKALRFLKSLGVQHATA